MNLISKNILRWSGIAAATLYLAKIFCDKWALHEMSLAPDGEAKARYGIFRNSSPNVLARSSSKSLRYSDIIQLEGRDRSIELERWFNFATDRELYDASSEIGAMSERGLSVDS
jgi:hypothetical protein